VSPFRKEPVHGRTREKELPGKKKREEVAFVETGDYFGRGGAKPLSREEGKGFGRKGGSGKNVRGGEEMNYFQSCLGEKERMG